MDDIPEPEVELFSSELDDYQAINDSIRHQFNMACESGDLRSTHYFAGRYENIYIDLDKVPALQCVLDAAITGARSLLGKPGMPLSVGFWFNEMQSGQVTLPHSHDEDEELVSAVYYVSTPPLSGDLVFTVDGASRAIISREGRLLCFRPEVIHEVTENKSGKVRLSIGMNIGPCR